MKTVIETYYVCDGCGSQNNDKQMMQNHETKCLFLNDGRCVVCGTMTSYNKYYSSYMCLSCISNALSV